MAYEIDGCEYEDLESYIQCGVLGHCGCGTVRSHLLYILGGLELIKKWSDPTMGGITYKAYRELATKHFTNDVAENFFYYIADKEDWVEHGTCLPGWLTAKGLTLLALLVQYKTELEALGLLQEEEKTP